MNDPNRDASNSTEDQDAGSDDTQYQKDEVYEEDDAPFSDDAFQGDSDDDLDIDFVEITGVSQSPDISGMSRSELDSLSEDTSIPGSIFDVDGTLSRSESEKDRYKQALDSIGGDKDENVESLFEGPFFPQFCKHVEETCIEDSERDAALGVVGVPEPILVSGNASTSDDDEEPEDENEMDEAYPAESFVEDTPDFGSPSDGEDGPPEIPDVIPSMDEPEFSESPDVVKKPVVPVEKKKIILGLGGPIEGTTSEQELEDPLEGSAAPLPVFDRTTAPVTDAGSSVKKAEADSVFVFPNTEDSGEVEEVVEEPEVESESASTPVPSPVVVPVVPAVVPKPTAASTPARPVRPVSPRVSTTAQALPELPAMPELVYLPEGGLNLRETLVKSMSAEERELFLKREGIFSIVSRGGQDASSMDELLLSAYSRFELRCLIAGLHHRVSSEFGVLEQHTGLLQELHDALQLQTETAAGIPEAWNRATTSFSDFVDSFSEAGRLKSEEYRTLREKLGSLIQEFERKLVLFGKEVAVVKKNAPGGSSFYRFCVLTGLLLSLGLSGFTAWRSAGSQATSTDLGAGSNRAPGILESEGLRVSILKSKDGTRYFRVLDSSGESVPFVEHAGGMLGKLPSEKE
jgi:hypothetical protein